MYPYYAAYISKKLLEYMYLQDFKILVDHVKINIQASAD